MNFKIFDDDFEDNKLSYKKEIELLSKNLIEKNMDKPFKSFVDENLNCTRNYYIILFALKTTQNILNGDSFELAPFKAFSFLPDVTFFQTMCMVCKKFLKKGDDLANFYNIKIENPKLENVIEKKDDDY